MHSFLSGENGSCEHASQHTRSIPGCYGSDMKWPPRARVLNAWFHNSWWNSLETLWQHLEVEPHWRTRSLAAGPCPLPVLLSVSKLIITWRAWLCHGRMNALKPRDQQVASAIKCTCQRSGLNVKWYPHICVFKLYPDCGGTAFAGRLWNLWAFGPSRRSGSCNGPWCSLVVQASEGHDAKPVSWPSHSKFHSFPLWWTDFPETVSQDKCLLSQIAQFSIVRYGPQWQETANTIVFTHCLLNLIDFWLPDGGIIVSYHYVLARFILPKKSSSLLLLTWSPTFHLLGSDCSQQNTPSVFPCSWECPFPHSPSMAGLYLVCCSV